MFDSRRVTRPIVIAIEEAIAQEETQPAQTEGSAAEVDTEAVALRQRAWPLLQMMKSANAAAQEIVWGV
jgi:hypothetical protein